MSILENIQGHEDLVGLSPADQIALCQEIRDFLISGVSKTGGHLASNLGVVELTVALETVFNTGKDRLVFDVGHQSYVHKLLTGRQASFDSLRQFGGIAGFPKPSESITDAFVAGHASSSVSIALGMARARTLLKEDYNVVAVLGDGAATGGMAYEGLNDAADSKEPLIVILNDNEMSIDRNVGGLSRHLSRLRTKERYLGMKVHYRQTMRRNPFRRGIYAITSRLKKWIKRSILPTTIFENMGMTYLGPVDGHNLPELIRLLNVAKALKCPVLLHVYTQKGCGYQPAEEQPSLFHGIGKFDMDTGETISQGKETFSDVFGKTMVELAGRNPNVCAITAAMPGGTGLRGFQEQFPKRIFDVGIAEEHAASMAGGLAKQGMIPVLALYSTFLQRSFDQILQDIAMLNLHVVLAVDRAGLVGEDGETHHGVYDVGMLRQIPGMRILCPATCRELSQMLTWAVERQGGPVAIRYPRGGNGALVDTQFGNIDWVPCHRDGGDVALISYGTLTNQVLEAAELLTKKGIDAKVLRLASIAPLPMDALVEQLDGCKKILIAEEACCGIGAALSQGLTSQIPGINVHNIDLGNRFITHGSIPELYHNYGLDAEAICNTVLEVFFNEN